MVGERDLGTASEDPTVSGVMRGKPLVIHQGVDIGTSAGAIQDSADISQARINPALLMSSERTSYDDKPRGVSVGGRPPGYLSEGDWIVLERYNGLNEPRLDIHEQSMCPGDSGKELKIA